MTEPIQTKAVPIQCDEVLNCDAVNMSYTSTEQTHPLIYLRSFKTAQSILIPLRQMLALSHLVSHLANTVNISHKHTDTYRPHQGFCLQPFPTLMLSTY